jgi:hypothetical protein
MSEPGLKCVWRGEAFKKGGGWLSSAYKKRSPSSRTLFGSLPATMFHTFARTSTLHSPVSRYFCVEKVQAEGAPEKFYGMRVLKYYKDKAAYEADPKKFKGAIRCSISTKMTVEKPKTSAELGGEEKQIFCLSFQVFCCLGRRGITNTPQFSLALPRVVGRAHVVCAIDTARTGQDGEGGRLALCR